MLDNAYPARLIMTDQSKSDRRIGKIMSRNIPTTVKNKELVEKHREQIILAAIKLFSQKGFHKTTLRELSEEAGLSYGNIYDYVGSKEDIFSLIHDYSANLTMKALRESIENWLTQLRASPDCTRRVQPDESAGKCYHAHLSGESHLIKAIPA